MRTGPILAEPRSTDVDRSAVAYPLWEEAAGATVDLPWRPASSLTAQDIAALLASASTAVVVAGAHACSTALVAHTLASSPDGCRVYLYGSRAIEKDASLRQRLAALSQRILARLGFDSPADWIVVDSGRAGWLLLGPPGAERRWLVPVDGAIARSLFEAFRVLFWFHATREGLPDDTNSFAFRTPLATPFPDPGKNVALPAGRLVLDGALEDPISDAEIRISPSGAAPGRAGVIFIPPDSNEFLAAQKLTTIMSRVVWTDTGLPRTTVSRERIVLDLVERPVALQLEWPQRDAIDMFHRLTRLALKPAWQFHASRQLGDIAGLVLLSGAAGSAPVQPAVAIAVPDIVAHLKDFDSAEPANVPDPAALVRRVTYRWKVVPPVVPAGAREAEIVRAWKVADEWARRRVDTLREALTNMEGEERGPLIRLRQWLTGHDEVRVKRNHLREQLNEYGESPPSQMGKEATRLVGGIAQAGQEVRSLVESAHGARVQAEDKADEAEQRTTWQTRVQKAESDLRSKRARLGSFEQDEAAAKAEMESAEAGQKTVIESRREERRAQLAGKCEALAAELEQERAKLKDLPPDQKRATTQKVQELEKQVDRITRQVDDALSWSPAASDMPKEQAQLQRARSALESVRKSVAAVSKEIHPLEVAANEPFAFKAPPRRAQPPSPNEAAIPMVPDEAPPEIGELTEYQGKRYLAVRTWEQVQRALPIAARLDAELVTFPSKPG
jgi:hypothetical protein